MIVKAKVREDKMKYDSIFLQNDFANVFTTISLVLLSFDGTYVRN